MDLGPAGYQKVKSFSGSYTEGISTDISIHFFGTHQTGSFTIKGENGAVVVLLAWGGETHRITLLETEKQAEGTTHDPHISSGNILLTILKPTSRVLRPTLLATRAKGNSYLHS
jgi:hypothetical protein